MGVNNILQFFENKAKTSPDHPAVIYNGIETSYGALEKKANSLAFELRCLGVKPQAYVAILVERNDLAYIAMLAILKIGAAYVPLDPEYPAERINYILQDCGVSLLITTQSLIQKHASFPCQLFLFDSALQSNNTQDIPTFDFRSIDFSPTNTCYVIYTSGSTGKPKGVEISHHSVANYLNEINRIYHLQSHDRIYQGFSLAFDASVEEIWGAFSAGATLISTNDKAIRSGAGLIEFLNQQQVTFFSTIPTLLNMLDPPIESLRLLVLGGEACQTNIIKRWSHSGLRILNTYGPTEATVVTTYSECHPDKPITLGHPLGNCEVCILDENLKPIGNNEEGELFIGGVGLSRGYVNRPDLNESKFIYHPDYNNRRFYRTGDLCRQLENGEIQYVGRLDGQVKLRGYRIELSEIESVIREHPEVQQAAVSLWESSPGIEFLAAYIVPENPNTFLKENIVGFLRQRLALYMIPNFFEIIDQIPLLPSGKINRKNLPEPKKDTHYNGSAENYSPPQTVAEKKIVQIWEKLFNKNSISIHDHFFYDLGGHSLLAAKATSILRGDSAFSHASVVDIYKNPTIEKLTASLAGNTRTRKIKSSKEAQETSTLKYYLCAFLQFLGVYFQHTITSATIILLFIATSYLYEQYTLSSLAMFFGILGLITFFPFALMGFSICMKWLLLGKVKPGTYPLWGFFYLRWWFIQRIQHTIINFTTLKGSPLINIYCRLMGAKIGKDCYIGSQNINAFDLLNIDNNSSINEDAALTGYIVTDGLLKIGSIKIGKRCYVGVRSVLDINTVMEDDSSLEDLSMLSENGIISQGKSYHGSPAQLNEKKKNNVQKNILEPYNFWKNVRYCILHYLGLLLVGAIYILCFIPGIMLMEHFYFKNGVISAILIGAPIGGLLFISLILLAIIVFKKILIGNIKPGVYQLKSSFYVRKWIADHLINLPEFYLISESVFFSPFLRLLGMKSGKRVEMAETPHITPELLTIQDEGFTASYVFINAPRIHLGQAVYTQTKIGKRTFIGNSAVLTPNTELGDNCLLGTMTVSPERSITSKSCNSAWLGSPPLFLPKREITHGFSEKFTFNPTKLMYLYRASIELIRVILPVMFSFLFVFFIYNALFYLMNHYSLTALFFAFPVLEMGVLFFFTLISIGLKWVLMGKYRPDKKPLWNIFIWKRDLLEHLHNYFLLRFIYQTLLGTPFISYFLRLQGAKVGKRAFINTANFTEHDLIEIGNDVSLNLNCIIMTHLYEDRIFKMDKIKIEDNCSVGVLSLLIYNTVMEENSTLGNLSLLIKGEKLPANSHWEGIPSQPK